MLAPRALPAAARAPLSALLSRLLADAAVAERLARIGAEPMAGDAASLSRLLDEETARWGAFIRRAGIQPE
jgi:tripartite-type tricarboxylate transporter receptor subunit TctC